MTFLQLGRICNPPSSTRSEAGSAAPVTIVAVSGTNLGDMTFTAKVDGTGDAINPTSHDANGASFTGLNVAAGHRLMVYRSGNLWFIITAQDSDGNNGE